MRTWFPAVRDAMGYNGYFIVSPDGINLASSRDENVGRENLLLGRSDFLDRIWSGQSAMSLPVVSDVPLADGDSVLRPGLPTMFAGAPIVADSGEIIAAFMFRLRPDVGFTGMRLRRIEATVEPENARCLRRLESLGFSREAQPRDGLWVYAATP